MFENPDALKTYTPQLQQLNSRNWLHNGNSTGLTPDRTESACELWCYAGEKHNNDTKKEPPRAK